MITQETIDLVKEKLQLPTSKTDRKIAAMDILLDATDDCRDERRGGYNIPRLNIKEIRILVNAICSEMNRASIAIDRDQVWVDKLQAASDRIADLDERNRHLTKFAIDIISSGQIGVR